MDRRACLAAMVLLLGAGCGAGDRRTRLVIYSPHGRDHLVLVERAFEAAHPDLDLRWLDMGSQEVLDRLRAERVNPQGDVWYGGPTVLFDQAVRESLLAPFRPSWADHVPAEAAGPDDLYFPAYRTPLVIAYNDQALTRAEAPQDWDELLDPRWADKVLIRDPMASGTMRALWGWILVRSLEQTGDTASGMAWLRRLDGQTRSYALNPAILYERLTRQEGLVTPWDLPDVLIEKSRGLPMGHVFPRGGTVVIDDAIAMIRGTRRPEAAARFIEWVGSVEAQLLTAREAWRLPARLDLPEDSLPEWAREVKAEMRVAPMDWGLLAREGPGWMDYWDRRVRGTGRRGG
jgi:iron(III) transport system substrate-binding protein